MKMLNSDWLKLKTIQLKVPKMIFALQLLPNLLKEYNF